MLCDSIVKEFTILNISNISKSYNFCCAKAKTERFIFCDDNFSRWTTAYFLILDRENRVSDKIYALLFNTCCTFRVSIVERCLIIDDLSSFVMEEIVSV